MLLVFWLIVVSPAVKFQFKKGERFITQYLFQMKNIGIVALLVLCLAALASGQSFTGGIMPHFYTGFTTAELTNQILPNVVYTQTLDRPAFDTTEQINIGTSLRDYSILNQIPVPGLVDPRYYAHIQIVNPRLSDNRQVFQFNIKTINSQANVKNVPLRIKHVSVNFIIVGSGLGGYYTSSGIPSSYIFARNSDMILPVTGTTTLIDFKTQTTGNAESPFLYNAADTTKYGGCGAAKRDGYWIIQTKACSSIHATVFITGFDQTVDPNTPPLLSNVITIGERTTKLNANLFMTDPVTGVVTFTADSTKDGLKLRLDGTPNTNFVQVSMIVVGLRQWTQGPYPIQGVFVDNFNVNTFVDETIPATSVLNSVPTPLPMTRGPAPPYYADVAANSFGHRFCGYTHIEFVRTAAFSSASQVAGFQLSLPQPNPDLTVPVLNVQSKVILGPSNLASRIALATSCLLFTAKNPCIKTVTSIPISSPSVTISNSATAGTPTGTVAFSGVPSNSPYASSSDPIPLNPVDYFSQQTMTQASTIVYTTRTPLANAVAGVYEGVLYFSFVAAAPAAGVTLTIRLTIFGNEVVFDTITSFTATKTYHFAFLNNNVGNNNIVITFVSTGAIPTHILEFGLFSESNVIDFNNNCATTCTNPSGTFIVGVDYLSVPPRCITCDTSLLLVFDPAKGSCACALGYTSVSGGCQACSYTLCGSCKSGITTCDRCVNNAVFVDTADITKGCTCLDGFYRSGSECVKCAPGCSKCTTGAACTTCVVNSNTRKAEIENCVCKPGFYEAGTPICPACSTECQTCETTATKCVSCDTANNFVLTGTTCTCKSSYYLAMVSGKAQCLKCHYSCGECKNDAASCVTCKTPVWTQVGDKCVCDQFLRFVYYDNSQIAEGICIQRMCNAIDPNCIECYMVMASGERLCKLCNENQGWTLSADNKTCTCKPGWVLNGDKCEQCGPGCLACSSRSVCTTCANGAAKVGVDSCACLPGNYLTTAFGPLQCMPCSPNCAQCQIEPFICTRCINGYVTDNFRCVCPTGRYSLDGVNCNACPTGCTKCTDANTCQNCATGYVLSSGRCFLDCPVGTYNGGDKCIQCSQGCRNCKSDIDCRACNLGLYLYLGTCRDVCPAGTYLYENTLCIACNPACKSCTGASGSCQACANGLVLSGNQCVQNCPDGSYYDGSKCSPCSSTCGKCSGTATTCTACPTGQFFYNGQCYATCPTAIVAGVCTNICQDGFYLSGTSCLKCSSTCVTCSAATTCTSCRSGFFSYNGQCVAKCPSNTLASGTSCIDCDANCVTCSESVNSCVSCKPGTFRLADRCYSTCPISHYADSSNNCKKCDADCKVCTGPGQCSVCLTNAAPVGGLCSPKCGSNCLQCQNGICTQCVNGFYWNGLSCQSFCPSGASTSSGFCVCPGNQALYLGNCVGTCPSGFTKVNYQCQACDASCKTCSTSISRCTSCYSGYDYDAVSNRCTKSTVCPYGQYRSNFEDCRFICPENTYYADSACYVGRCPVGFTPDDNSRTCVKSTLPNGCNAPYYLQGSDCVVVCDSGFYANAQNRVCLPCSSGCAVCTGPSSCTSCLQGSSLSNGVCVISSFNCPVGQFRFNDICVSTCPAGTFNREGYCVRQCAANLYFWQRGCYEFCPTNLRTDDACVLVCPNGFSRRDALCVPISNQQCASNQYFNSAIGSCDACRSPCSSCQGNSNFCTGCVNNFNLRDGGVCVSSTSCPNGLYLSSTGCQKCSAKCATCTDFSVCSTCAPTYSNTGSDCVQNGGGALTPVTLQYLLAVKRGNTVFIQLQATILPRNLPSSLASQIVTFVPSVQPNPASRIIIWVRGNDVFVALQHPSAIPTYVATILLNIPLFSESFASMGYSISDAFVQVPISQSLPDAPSSFVIPDTAYFSRQFDVDVLRGGLNKALTFALKQIQIKNRLS